MMCHMGTEGCRDTSDRTHDCPPLPSNLDAEGRLCCRRCGQRTPSTISGVCVACYPLSEHERVYGRPPNMPTLVPTSEAVPAQNGRSLSFGAVVFYAERAIPRAGILAGDRIVVRPSGAAMLTRMLAPSVLAAPDAPVPTRPPCTVEGCALNDCPACRYITALEAQLAARATGDVRAIMAPACDQALRLDEIDTMARRLSAHATHLKPQIDADTGIVDVIDRFEAVARAVESLGDFEAAFRVGRPAHVQPGGAN